MTEGFLKPNAKTAFLKAILKFCTANQLFEYTVHNHLLLQSLCSRSSCKTVGKSHCVNMLIIILCILLIREFM